jgi:hypothetical protein
MGSPFMNADHGSVSLLTKWDFMAGRSAMVALHRSMPGSSGGQRAGAFDFLAGGYSGPALVQAVVAARSSGRGTS